MIVTGQPYFAVFFALAQRAFCAAAILARASAESRRFLEALGALAVRLRPSFELSVKIALTCCKRVISASISARMPFISIGKF